MRNAIEKEVINPKVSLQVDQIILYIQSLVLYAWAMRSQSTIVFSAQPRRG